MKQGHQVKNGAAIGILLALAIMLPFEEGTATDTSISPKGALVKSSPLSSPAAAGTDIPAPTWPRSFSIASGARAGFTVPNPGQGTIKVTVEWSGANLAIGVYDMNAKTIIPAVTRSTPFYTFEINAASMSQSAVPVFVVGAALAGGSGTASGRVSVVSLPADMNVISRLVSPKLQQMRTLQQAAPQMSATFLSQSQAQVAAARQAIENQNATLSRNLQSIATMERTRYSNTLGAMARTAKSAIRVRPVSVLSGVLAMSASMITGAAASQPSPAITAISPGVAMPGDQVTLTASGLESSTTEVWFTLPGRSAVQANILGFGAGANGTCTVKVQMPDQPGATTQQAIQVYARALDRNPAASTNTVQMQYKPMVVPSIAYMDPVEVSPGKTMTIDGNNFTPNDTVRFVLTGIFDITVPTTFVNSTRLTATVPVYVLKQLTGGYVCTQRPISTGLLYSQAQPIMFRPTVPVIASAPASIAADSPFTIVGMGFEGSGEVHAVDAGSGRDLILKIDSWTDTHIVARGPSIYGFTGTKPLSFYVKNASGRKGDPRAFNLTPATYVTLMDLSDIQTLKDYELGSNVNSNIFKSAKVETSICTSHSAEFLWGFSGIDKYFLRRQLKNGWKVDKVNFGAGSSDDAGVSILMPYVPGTSSVLVQVLWNCYPAWNFIHYEFSIQISGPRGVPY